MGMSIYYFKSHRVGELLIVKFCDIVCNSPSGRTSLIWKLEKSAIKFRIFLFSRLFAWAYARNFCLLNTHATSYMAVSFHKKAVHPTYLLMMFIEKRTLKKNYHKFSHQPQYISLTPDQKFRVCTAVGESLRHPLMEWTSNYLHCLYYILLVHIDQHQLSVGSVSNMMIFFFCLELREGVKFKFISLLFWYKKLRVVLSYDMTI